MKPRFFAHHDRKRAIFDRLAWLAGGPERAALHSPGACLRVSGEYANAPCKGATKPSAMWRSFKAHAQGGGVPTGKPLGCGVRPLRGRIGRWCVSFALGVALLFLAGSAPAQVDLRDPFDARMQAGAEAYAKQDYEAAARHFGDARLIRPDSPEAAMNQGLALARQEEFDEALETLGDAETLGRGREEFAPLPQFNEGVAHLRRAESLLKAAEEDPKQATKESRAQTIDSLIGAIDAFADVDAPGQLGDAARVGRALAQSKLAAISRPAPTPPPDQQPSDEQNKDQQQQDQQQQDQQNQDQQQSDQQQDQNQEDSQSSEQKPGEKNQRGDNSPRPTPTPAPGMEANQPPDFNKPTPSPTPAPTPGKGEKPEDEAEKDGKDDAEKKDGEGDQQQAQAAQAQEGEGDGEGQPVQLIELSDEEAERLLNMVDDKMLMFRQGRLAPPKSGKDW